MRRSTFLTRIGRPGALGAVVLTASLLLTACVTSGPVVHTDYDHAANFTAYRTFGFPENTGTDRGGYQTLATSHFKEAVRREMTARGYSYVESGPELLVNFYSEVHDKTQVYPSPYPGPYFGTFGFRYGRPRFGFFSAWPFYEPDVDIVQYKSGTLKLDVVDAAHKQLVWEARVEERLTDQAQDNPQPMIERLVAEMFKKFPRSAN
jgi:hypothetical protein